MPIGEICTRDVIVTDRNTTVDEAAHLMRHHHVGNLIIVSGEGESRIPVGIVTDRDIVISVVGLKLDPGVFTVGDLVTESLVTVREDQGIFETIQQMRRSGVRRIPVVDRQGILVGIISVDDLIDLLASELGELAKLISNEQAREAEKKQ